MPLRGAARIALVALVVGGALGAGACGERSRAAEVVVYTSVDQVFSEPIFRAFERESGIHVRPVYDTEETKSTGVVNRLIAERDHPQADVFWCGDPVRPFLLIDRGMVEPYVSPGAAAVPAQFRAADGAWTGLAARARVILVNTRLVPTDRMPRSIQDLADPQWRGRTAIANPLFGTTTMQVAALFTDWGEVRGRAFMDSLRTNQVRLAASNGEVRRLVVDGEVAFGLTDTDDAAEATRSGAPVATIYPDQDGLGTLVMPTSVVLLRGGPNGVQGRRLIDFMLTPDVERLLAENGAHMPLHPGVPVPAGVRPASDIRAMDIHFRRVATQMERMQPWLRQWVGI
jgi:iron(III) transport system substrate-binding protein